MSMRQAREFFNPSQLALYFLRLRFVKATRERRAEELEIARKKGSIEDCDVYHEFRKAGTIWPIHIIRNDLYVLEREGSLSKDPRRNNTTNVHYVLTRINSKPPTV